MKNCTFLRLLLLFSFNLIVSNFIGQVSNIQDTLKVYRIELTDGSEFIGNILQQDSGLIVLQTSILPRVDIPREKIKSIEELHEKKHEKDGYWFANPHATRYLISPSAFNLKKGEGYYQNTWILLNSFNYGITNHISLGGGIEFLSTFGSLSQGRFNPIFFLTPKMSFQISERLHAGGGILFLHFPGAGSAGNLGIVYSMATYGNTDNNVNLALGWGFSGEELAQRPIITLSGMKRMTRKTGFVTENWILPYNFSASMWSYGIRFFGEKMSVDLAFFNNTEIAPYLLIGIPFVSFTIKF